MYLVGGVAVAALWLLAIGYTSNRIDGEYSNLMSSVARSQQVVSLAEMLDSEFENAEGRFEMLMATSSPDIADQYHAMTVDVPLDLKRLRSLLTHRDQLKRMDNIESAVLLEFRENLRTLESRGEAGGQRSPPRNYRVVAAHIGRQIEELQQNEQALVEQQNQIAEHLGWRHRLIHLVLLLFSLFGLFFSSWMIDREYHQLATRQGELAGVRAQLQQSNTELSASVELLADHNRYIESLNRLVELLQSCVRLEEAYEVLAGGLAKLTRAEAGSLLMMRSSRNLLERVSSWGEPRLKADIFPPEWCWGVRRGRSHFVEHEGKGPRCEHMLSGEGAAPVLCVPLAAHGETLGLVCLEGISALDYHRAKERRFVTSAAEQISLALANLKLREALKDQSIRDPLTNLFNRRYMEESFDRELARASRNNSEIALLFVDVDHFKTFNDDFGHTAGDLVLREIGKVLRSCVRTDDIACRMGGEEFAVILPGMGLAQGLARADEIREAIAHIQLTASGMAFREATVSVGVAVFPRHGHVVEELVRAADAALYRAKNEGRNRTLTAEAAAVV